MKFQADLQLTATQFLMLFHYSLKQFIEKCRCLCHNDMSVSISHVSVKLFMRLRFVSVTGEFLWSGERFVDHDVQCFPGGHCYTLGMLLQSSQSP